MAKRPDPQTRAQRQHARDYEARQSLHARQTRRRLLDNWIGVAAAVVVIGLAVFGVWAYSAWGPGYVEPTATASPTPTPTDDIAGPLAALDCETDEPLVATADPLNVGAPDPALAEGRVWTGTIGLNDIELGVQLCGGLAPQAVAGMVQDAASGYYVGKTCHRLADSTDFQLLQCGSLDGTGAGDPAFSYGPIENAPADDWYPAGTIAMARAGGDAYSNGHQFFIVTSDTSIPSDEAGGYAVVGRVVSGLEGLITGVMDAGTVDGSADGAPAVPVTITGFTIE